MAATDVVVRIDAMQTVIPAKVTDPGQSRRLVLAGPLRPETLQTHLRIVLYYKRAGEEEESARTVAAWIKESLAAVLPEHPLLAGRLRRDGEDDGYWVVKFNDAGVRLVQATAATTVEELLGYKDLDAREAQLAYWPPIDAENPNFSPLFCIQVTEFEGDGYSVGISCSLLLADPLFLTQFIEKWVIAHNLMVAQCQLSKPPIFHLDYFQSPGRGPPAHLSSTSQDSTTTSNTTTIHFKVPHRAGAGAAFCNALASRCLDEASRKLEGRTVSEFSLLVSDHSGDLEVDSCCTKDGSSPGKTTLEVAWWDEFGMEEVAFVEGNKPVHVSYRIVSAADHGLVVAMVPSSDEGDGASPLLFSVTVPRS